MQLCEHCLASLPFSVITGGHPIEHSHLTTEISPAELLFGRKPKVVLDLSRPNLMGKVLKKQEEQKHYHDQRHSNRNLQVGQTVYLWNFATGPLWLPEVIAQVLGPLSYLCTLREGRRVKRHIDHLRERYSVSRRNNEDEESERQERTTYHNKS